jgi:peptidoglycan/LPS O-acetylase OafA/YrhL
MKLTDARALISKSQNYRPDIDGLRALAVMAVILFHAFPKVIPGGFVGVDIFFVISGFLITQIVLSDLDSGKFSAWTFYARRIRRIFPALIVVLGFTMAFFSAAG